jgi:3-deoxy-manno-octulosonate cytidylyltransferase (CMP-KDO synthetase)
VCDRLVVATDAEEIAAVVRRHGGEAVLTSPAHASGTERVAEVALRPEFTSFDLILNVQGDEPLVAPEAITGSVARVRSGDPIGTAAGRLDAALAGDPSRVKVVLDLAGRALYFSRSPIPCDRDGDGDVVYRQHVGVYAYTRDALRAWVTAPSVPEERWERLEQLRPLRHGIAIGVHVWEGEPARGVDTPDDLAWTEAAVSGQLKGVSP